MPPNPPDRRATSGLAGQLRWVHDMLRRDLASVRGLATAVAEGAAPDAIRVGLLDLQSQGPLFRLRSSCLGYCQLVHAHHHHEDVGLFPAARQSAPHLVETIDRLEADHRIVSRLLDQVEERALDLDGEPARRALVGALTDLSATLLDHLELEEATLGPVLDAWTTWPDQAPTTEIREQARRLS